MRGRSWKQRCELNERLGFLREADWKLLMRKTSPHMAHGISYLYCVLGFIVNMKMSAFLVLRAAPDRLWS